MLSLECGDLFGRRRCEIGQVDVARAARVHIPDRNQPAILAGCHRDDSLLPIGGGESEVGSHALTRRNRFRQA